MKSETFSPILTQIRDVETDSIDTKNVHYKSNRILFSLETINHLKTKHRTTEKVAFKVRSIIIEVEINVC